MIDRPYQVEAFEKLGKFYTNGGRRGLIVHATGTGKGRIISRLRQRLNFKKRVLILAERDFLLQQIIVDLKEDNPELDIGLEKASSYVDDTHDVVVASVQSIGVENSPRLQRLNPDDFDVVITEEAHHATAPRYDVVYRHFGVAKSQPLGRILHVGVTATVDRSDKVGLDSVFDDIVHEYSILDGVSDGWLADLRGLTLTTDVDLDVIAPHSGDFTQEEIERAINILKRNKLIVDGVIKHSEGRNTLVFCSSIGHSKVIADLLRAEGVAAEAIWGVDKNRKAKLERFKRGDLKVLTNQFVLGEGVNLPNAGCAVLGRPTTSALVHRQQVGRTTRPIIGVPGMFNIHEAIAQGIVPVKKDAIIIDVVDNTSRHSLCTLASLYGLPAKMNLNGESLLDAIKKVKAQKEKMPHIDLSELDNLKDIESHARHVELFTERFDPQVLTNSKLSWIKTGEDRFVLSMTAHDIVSIKKNTEGDFIVQGRVSGQTLHEVCNTSGEAMRFAEAWTRAKLGRNTWMLKRHRQDAPWRQKPITEKQKEMLSRLMGKAYPKDIDQMLAGRAGDLITEYKAKRGML